MSDTGYLPCMFPKPKPPMGWYVLKTGFDHAFDITSIKLALAYKPNWVTRFAMKHIFGILWEDANE